MTEPGRIELPPADPDADLEAMTHAERVEYVLTHDMGPWLMAPMRDGHGRLIEDSTEGSES